MQRRKPGQIQPANVKVKKQTAAKVIKDTQLNARMLMI